MRTSAVTRPYPLKDFFFFFFFNLLPKLACMFSMSFREMSWSYHAINSTVKEGEEFYSGSACGLCLFIYLFPFGLDPLDFHLARLLRVL